MRRGVIVFMAAASLLANASAFSGTEGASFLDIPVGAAPAALGGAYTARATNAYAPVYNPGGLGRVRQGELAVQHLDYIENFKYEFASLAIPFRNQSTMGVSLQYLTSGNLERTDNVGNKSGEFSNSYGAFGLSFGHQFANRFSLGATGKFIRGKLDDTSASAFAADFGGLYKVSDKFDLGAAVMNLGSGLKFDRETDSLPLATKVGVGYTPVSAWTFSADGIYGKSKLASLHGGIEWRAADLLSLRVGYRTDTVREASAAAGFTAGVGIKIWEHEFSYAYLPLDDLGGTNYFSLLLRFATPYLGDDPVQARSLNVQTQEPEREAFAVDLPDQLPASNEERSN